MPIKTRHKPTRVWDDQTLGREWCSGETSVREMKQTNGLSIWDAKNVRVYGDALVEVRPEGNDKKLKFRIVREKKRD